MCSMTSAERFSGLSVARRCASTCCLSGDAWWTPVKGKIVSLRFAITSREGPVKNIRPVKQKEALLLRLGKTFLVWGRCICGDWRILRPLPSLQMRSKGNTCISEVTSKDGMEQVSLQESAAEVLPSQIGSLSLLFVQDSAFSRQAPGADL